MKGHELEPLNSLNSKGTHKIISVSTVREDETQPAGNVTTLHNTTVTKSQAPKNPSSFSQASDANINVFDQHKNSLTHSVATHIASVFTGLTLVILSIFEYLLDTTKFTFINIHGYTWSFWLGGTLLLYPICKLTTHLLSDSLLYCFNGAKHKATHWSIMFYILPVESQFRKALFITLSFLAWIACISVFDHENIDIFDILNQDLNDTNGNDDLRILIILNKTFTCLIVTFYILLLKTIIVRWYCSHMYLKNYFKKLKRLFQMESYLTSLLKKDEIFSPSLIDFLVTYPSHPNPSNYFDTSHLYNLCLTATRFAQLDHNPTSIHNNNSSNHIATKRAHSTQELQIESKIIDIDKQDKKKLDEAKEDDTDANTNTDLTSMADAILKHCRNEMNRDGKDENVIDSIEIIQYKFKPKSFSDFISEFKNYCRFTLFDRFDRFSNNRRMMHRNNYRHHRNNTSSNSSSINIFNDGGGSNPSTRISKQKSQKLIRIDNVGDKKGNNMSRGSIVASPAEAEAIAAQVASSSKSKLTSTSISKSTGGEEEKKQVSISDSDKKLFAIGNSHSEKNDHITLWSFDREHHTTLIMDTESMRHLSDILSNIMFRLMGNHVNSHYCQIIHAFNKQNKQNTEHHHHHHHQQQQRGKHSRGVPLIRLFSSTIGGGNDAAHDHDGMVINSENNSHLMKSNSDAQVLMRRNSNIDDIKVSLKPRDYFIESDFICILCNKDETKKTFAQKAFSKFDKSKNGRVYFDDLRQRLLSFFLNIVNVRSTFESFKDILLSLQSASTIFIMFILIFVYLIIFEFSFLDAVSLYVSIIAIGVFFGSNPIARVINGVTLIFAMYVFLFLLFKFQVC